MNTLNVNDFMQAATLSHERVVVDHTHDSPKIVSVNQSINGKILSWLSNIPLFRSIETVKAYATQVHTQNQIALAVFIEALSKKFGVKAAGTALETATSIKDFALNKRTIKTLTSIAENMHGRGEAKPLARQVVLRVWEYKSILHPGHAAVSIKNQLPEKSMFHYHEYVSWWPENGDSISSAIKGEKATPNANYQRDKRAEISENTEKKLILAQEAANKNEKVNFFPKAAQKQKDGDWGLSAQKVYFPLIGLNKAVSIEGENKQTFSMFGLDEKALIEDARLVKDKAKKGEMGYTFVSKTENCASMAIRMLRAGGAENFVPFSSAWFAEDPNTAHEYAKSVQNEIDLLNRKADDFENYSTRLSEQDNTLQNELNSFEGVENQSFSTIQNHIDNLNGQLQIEKKLKKKKELSNALIVNHQKQIGIISAKFKEQVATLSDTDKKRLASLIQAMDHPPHANDDLATLTKKAKHLVEAAHSLMIGERGSSGINNDRMLFTAHAMIKQLEAFMMLKTS